MRRVLPQITRGVGKLTARPLRGTRLVQLDVINLKIKLSSLRATYEQNGLDIMTVGAVERR